MRAVRSILAHAPQREQAANAAVLAFRREREAVAEQRRQATEARQQRCAQLFQHAVQAAAQTQVDLQEILAPRNVRSSAHMIRSPTSTGAAAASGGGGECAQG